MFFYPQDSRTIVAPPLIPRKQNAVNGTGWLAKINSGRLIKIVILSEDASNASVGVEGPHGFLSVGSFDCGPR